MNCSYCDTRTDGQPVVMFCVDRDGSGAKELRFTGVVMCGACSTHDRHARHLADELEWIERHQPARTTANPTGERSEG